MSALDKITSILEEVDTVTNILAEGISPKEKKEINQIINKKKSGAFQFGDVDVVVKANNKEIAFSYTGKGSEDLTFALTDIADARGLEFKYGIAGGKVRFGITL